MFRAGSSDRRSLAGQDGAFGAPRGDELVRRARLGDGAAMAALYTRHAQPVHAYLVLQETTDAAQIVGDAFAAAFASLAVVNGGDRAFRVHVLAHAHELLIIEATTDHNRGRSPMILPPVARRYLRALVPTQRDVIALQISSGLAVSEAAAVLRVSEPMAQAAQSRALRRLEHASTGAMSAVPSPSHLAVAVARDGGHGAIAALAAAAETVAPIAPPVVLRARFASVVVPDLDRDREPSSRRFRVKAATVVGTSVGKVVLSAGIAAATAGGAHVAGVVDLPLLPPVTQISSTQEINENPTSTSPVGVEDGLGAPFGSGSDCPREVEVDVVRPDSC